jgi:hypothetical protein
MEEQLQLEAQHVIEEVQDQGQEDAGSEDDEIPTPAVPRYQIRPFHSLVVPLIR